MSEWNCSQERLDQKHHNQKWQITSPPDTERENVEIEIGRAHQETIETEIAHPAIVLLPEGTTETTDLEKQKASISAQGIGRARQEEEEMIEIEIGREEDPANGHRGWMIGKMKRGRRRGM